MSKRTISYIVIILIMLVIAIGVYITQKQTKNTEELQTIKVNEVTRSVFYAPQYVAINNGYFKENGMEIELSTGQGAETPPPRQQTLSKIRKPMKTKKKRTMLKTRLGFQI